MFTVIKGKYEVGYFDDENITYSKNHNSLQQAIDDANDKATCDQNAFVFIEVDYHRLKVEF